MCVCLFVCVHVFPSLSQDANNCFLFHIITYMVTVSAGITVFACFYFFPPTSSSKAPSAFFSSIPSVLSYFVGWLCVGGWDWYDFLKTVECLASLLFCWAMDVAWGLALLPSLAITHSKLDVQGTGCGQLLRQVASMAQSPRGRSGQESSRRFWQNRCSPGCKRGKLHLSSTQVFTHCISLAFFPHHTSQ